MRITPRIGIGMTISMIPKITKKIKDLVFMLIAWAFLDLFIRLGLNTLQIVLQRVLL